MPRARSAGHIAFMVMWIVVWTAAILVAVWTLGAEALAGEVVPVLFLLAWVAAAGFALFRAASTLLGLAAGRSGLARRRGRGHAWDDGLPDRAPGADDDRAA